MSSPERSRAYRLVAESGLRAGELRSLTRLSFSFGRKFATVTVEAGSSKRRRRDELPLRPDTAEELREHL
jgi:integrase